jgi:hypothetical protein
LEDIKKDSKPKLNEKNSKIDNQDFDDFSENDMFDDHLIPIPEEGNLHKILAELSV